MPNDEEDILNSDFDGLSGPEMLVMLIMSGDMPVSRSRLQKLAFIYDRLYARDDGGSGPVARFSQGSSDDIDQSATDLKDMGVLDEGRGGYSLTGYGARLKGFILREYADVGQMEHVENIKKALSSIPDRDLVGMAYRFYGDSAIDPKMKRSVVKLNSESVYDGTPLSEYPKDRFESKLRNGEGIGRS